MVETTRIITLMTDFGLQDVYVGVMKGIIAQINPEATVIDLSHQIPPQDVAAARFSLMNAYAYFPEGTVHIAVVDPGVGTRRRAIAVEIAQGFLVGPDNGLFSGVLSQTPATQTVELTNRQFWRTPFPSATFHGRDVFASVGAYLAGKVPIHQLGNLIDPGTLAPSPVPDCSEIRDKTNHLMAISGQIQYIDRFGNAITNIPGSYIDSLEQNQPIADPDSEARNPWSLALRNITIPGYRTYSDVSPGEPLALVGSHGWVEIAVNGGHAQYQLRLKWGDLVKVQPQKAKR